MGCRYEWHTGIRCGHPMLMVFSMLDVVEDCCRGKNSASCRDTDTLTGNTVRDSTPSISQLANQASGQAAEAVNCRSLNRTQSTLGSNPYASRPARTGFHCGRSQQPSDAGAVLHQMRQKLLSSLSKPLDIPSQAAPKSAVHRTSTVADAVQAQKNHMPESWKGSPAVNSQPPANTAKAPILRGTGGTRRLQSLLSRTIAATSQASTGRALHQPTSTTEYGGERKKNRPQDLGGQACNIPTLNQGLLPVSQPGLKGSGVTQRIVQNGQDAGPSGPAMELHVAQRQMLFKRDTSGGVGTLTRQHPGAGFHCMMQMWSMDIQSTF